MGKKRRASQPLQPNGEDASTSKNAKIDTDVELKEETIQKPKREMKNYNPSTIERLSEKLKKLSQSRKEAEEINVPDNVSIVKFAECRAGELATVMKELERKKPKQTLQQLPHHMRRRAASHNANRIPRRLREKAAREINKAKKTKRPSRKHRRRPSNLLEEYQRRSRNHVWLETHIWFAKRFKMEKLWGYQIPVEPIDKNRRLLYRSIKQYSVLQDLSYLCCIELEGQMDVLLNSLSQLTDSSTGLTFASKAYTSGKKEGTLVIYHAGGFPFHAIGPVSFLWQPEINSTRNEIPNSRKLWIWCHPTIHSELVSVVTSLFNAAEDVPVTSSKDDSINAQEVTSKENDKIQSTSKSNVEKKKRKPKGKSKRKENISELLDQKLVNKFKAYTSYSRDGIKIYLLKDNLVRYRLIGPKAHAIVADVLKPADMSVSKECDKWWDDYYSEENMLNFHEGQKSVLSKMTQANLPPRTVIGCTVKDPRLYIPPQKTRIMPNVEDEDHSRDIDNFRDLPDNLEMSPLWDRAVRDKVTATKMPECELNKMRSRFVVPDMGLQLGREESRVPIIAIQQDQNGCGWDIIAPLGWGMAFWLAFIYRGGRAFGLRELKSFSQEKDVLLMPYNYPDTKGGSQWEEENRKRMIEKHYRYPPDKRPSFEKLGILNPFFVPWDVLVKDWIRLSQQDENQVEAKSIVSIEEPFFVLREKKCIKQLQETCKLMQKLHSQSLHKNDNITSKNILDNLNTLLNNGTKMCQSLICVKLKSFTKGNIDTFSGIYALDETDVIKMKQGFRYRGPNEVVHKKKPLDQNSDASSEHSTNKTERPSVVDLVVNNSHKLIGYVEGGSYSYFDGCGLGLGHCSLVGFLHNLKQCLDSRLTPSVLVRAQDSFQYRPVHIDVNVP